MTFDEPVWNLCEALVEIPGVDIVWSDRGMTDQPDDCYWIGIAVWSLDALNVLRHVVGHDGTRLCLCLSPHNEGDGSEIDDPLSYFDLIGGPSPTANEVAATIRDVLAALGR